MLLYATYKQMPTYVRKSNSLLPAYRRTGERERPNDLDSKATLAKTTTQTRISQHSSSSSSSFPFPFPLPFPSFYAHSLAMTLREKLVSLLTSFLLGMDNIILRIIRNAIPQNRSRTFHSNFHLFITSLLNCAIVNTICNCKCARMSMFVSEKTFR